MTLKHIIPHLRNTFKESMMRPALAERLIPCIYNLHKCFVSSYFFWGLFIVGSFLSHYFAGSCPCDCVVSYFSPFILFMGLNGDDSGRDNRKKADYFAEFGGEGARVAYYLRVSTTKQAKYGRSIDAQRDSMNRIIEAERPSIVYGYVDGGKSGTAFDNRKTAEVIALAKDHLIDEFWVAYIDRIGRNLIEMLEFLVTLWKNNVYIRTPEKLYTNDNLADILHLVIESYISESSNNKRKERANNSKRKNFLDKKWNKPVIPVGYNQNREGWLSRIDELNPFIYDVFASFLKGYKFAKISRKINEKYSKIIDGTLSSARIKSILRDPIYIGKPEHSGAVVEDFSLRIISNEVYNQTQERLKKIKKTRKNSQEKKPILSLVEKYGLSVLDFLNKNHKYFCDYCGGDLVKNGTRKIDGIDRQNFLCKKCGKQIWVPNQFQLKEINEYQEEKTRTVNPLKDLNPKKRDKKLSKKKKRNSQNSTLDNFFKMLSEENFYYG